MRPNPKHWRESASIIALAKNGLNTLHNKHTSDYRILVQERSDKSKFLPSTAVFPGGTVEECDSSESWLKHFNAFGLRRNDFKHFYSKNTLNPPILHGFKDPVIRHVCLRITAIRETFEELGILICKQRHEDPLTRNKCASFVTDFDVKHWQSKVHRDPGEFLLLCEHLDCYPDICSLFLWSNWLTPIGYASQRFDTLFFLAGFDTAPPVHAETSEVSQVWWASPQDLMEKFNRKEITLPPPQFYELSRLSHQKDINKLLQYSSARASLGCDQIYPILVSPTKGSGHIAIFPGDELYPTNPDFEKQDVIDVDNATIEELQNSAKVTHRMEIYDLYTIKHQLKNFAPVQCQLSPVNGMMPNLTNISEYCNHCILSD